MTVYFTSDLHLGHRAVLQLANRPFEDVEEMNRVFIENINATVKPEDTLCILGDVGYRISKDEASELIKQINCKDIRLVTGNHDKDWKDSELFTEVCNYKEIKLDGFRVCLMHYPIMSWNGMYRQSLHLHGHIHSKPDYNKENIAAGLRRFDVGVDANNFKPVSWEEIKAAFSIEDTHVNYRQRIDAVSKLCGGDDRLFARYGYKFMQDFEKEDAEVVATELKEKPAFTNEFQEIYITGLLEHYFGKGFLPWMSDKSLPEPWFYGGECGFDSPDIYNTFDELKARNIFV